MNIISSTLASFIASLIYFITSFFFDKQINVNLSNIIASVLSISIDIVLQSYFAKKLKLLKSKAFLVKAFIFEMLTVYFNQLLFSKTYTYTKEKNIEVKTLYIRLFVSIVLFLIYTYPVRKFILYS
jgi:hypothetical protein